MNIKKSRARIRELIREQKPDRIRLILWKNGAIMDIVEQKATSLMSCNRTNYGTVLDDIIVREAEEPNTEIFLHPIF